MKRFVIGIVLSATMLGGCLKATFTTNSPAVGRMQEKKVTFFVYGLLGQPQVVDVNQLCPGGNISMIRTGLTAGNLLLQGFTGGLVARRTVWYSCGSAPSAQNEAPQESPSAELFLITDEEGVAQLEQVSAANK